MAGLLSGAGGAVLHPRGQPDRRRRKGEVSAEELRGNSRAQTTWIAGTLVVVLSLAVYGTVALARGPARERHLDRVGGASAPASTRASRSRSRSSRSNGGSHIGTRATAGSRRAQLVLPVGQKIEFHVTSLDVVHSFWFFALGVKADAVPLNDNIVSATPTQIGTYRVQCSELCGLWHGNMADDTAMVVSPSDFASVDPAGDDTRRADHEVPACRTATRTSRTQRSTGTDDAQSANTREEADVDAVAPARRPMESRPTLSRRLHEWGLLLGVIGAVRRLLRRMGDRKRRDRVLVWRGQLDGIRRRDPARLCPERASGSWQGWAS